MLFFLVAATIHSLFSLSLVLRSFMCFQGFKKKKKLELNQVQNLTCTVQDKKALLKRRKS